MTEPTMPPIPAGDRFKNPTLFLSLGIGAGTELYECWEDAIYAYARQYAAGLESLADSEGTRAVDYLRRARKAEARIKEADAIILRLTADDNSEQNYVRGIDEANHYFGKYADDDAIKKGTP